VGFGMLVEAVFSAKVMPVIVVEEDKLWLGREGKFWGFSIEGEF